MYDTENVEFKFPRLRRHIKLASLDSKISQAFCHILNKNLLVQRSVLTQVFLSVLYFQEYVLDPDLFNRCLSKDSSLLLLYRAYILLNESCFKTIFRVLLFRKYFLGFPSVAKYFLGS